MIPCLASAQVNDTSYNNQIKFAATRLIDIFNPGIEISYERLHGEHFSSQLSIKYPVNIIDNVFKQLRGYALDFEEKYFMNTSTKKRKYISIDLNYNNINYKEKTSGIDNSNNAYSTDTIKISRKSQSVAIKYGAQFYKKHFVLDVAFGFGVKHRNVKHYGITLDNQVNDKGIDFLRGVNSIKNDFTVMLPFTIRLGYRF